MGIIDIVTLAISLILKGDSSVLTIVGLSLTVSISAVLLATVIGLPIGALVALTRFPGRAAVVLLLNAAMGLPPVVVGLALYLLLSRAGPLGEFGLLFTPTAMVFAQAVLVLPIIAALGRQTVADLWVEYGDLLHSFGNGPLASAPTLLWDARYSLATAVLAGFGRAIAEVGAVMIVGGNIAGVTRTMTTTIALETSKGNLALAMVLGTILMGLSILVNGGVQLISSIAGRKQA
ncbi:MAG TPA: ABC transporter permease [Telmatospirillum sp.]|nr:ABC transporter permease [Telmatospirillum sp.]